MPERWRTGRKVGRTIYRQTGPYPSDEDPLIGVMDTVALAHEAVEAHNFAIDLSLPLNPLPPRAGADRPCPSCHAPAYAQCRTPSGHPLGWYRTHRARRTS